MTLSIRRKTRRDCLSVRNSLANLRQPRDIDVVGRLAPSWNWQMTWSPKSVGSQCGPEWAAPPALSETIQDCWGGREPDRGILEWTVAIPNKNSNGSNHYDPNVWERTKRPKVWIRPNSSDNLNALCTCLAGCASVRASTKTLETGVLGRNVGEKWNEIHSNQVLPTRQGPQMP